MSHEDEEAAELEHAEEVGLLIFPARDEAAEVMQPSKQPFDFPTVAVASQLPAVLSVFPAAIALVRSDQTDAVFFSQPLVERIAVVGRVADHSFWFGSREALLDGGFHESFSCGEALAMLQATGRPWRSAIAMILLPLPRRVGPTAAPLFSPN